MQGSGSRVLRDGVRIINKKQVLKCFWKLSLGSEAIIKFQAKEWWDCKTKLVVTKFKGGSTVRRPDKMAFWLFCWKAMATWNRKKECGRREEKVKDLVEEKRD